MFYVYHLQSRDFPKQHYTGFTTDLKKRFGNHNRGENKSTAPYAPWNLTFYCAFDSKEKAKAFEAYLKTGSGRAFASKRLL